MPGARRITDMDGPQAVRLGAFGASDGLTSACRSVPRLYVQKSTSTTLPRTPSAVSGAEFSQVVARPSDARSFAPDMRNGSTVIKWSTESLVPIHAEYTGLTQAQAYWRIGSGCVAQTACTGGFMYPDSCVARAGPADTMVRSTPPAAGSASRCCESSRRERRPSVLQILAKTPRKTRPTQTTPRRRPRRASHWFLNT